MPVLRWRAARHRRGPIERLDKVPAQLRVIVTRRPKYACRACERRRRRVVYPGAGAGAADRGRPADRGDGRRRAGVESTPITCRSIGRRRSWPARAIAHRSLDAWPTGSGRGRRSCSRCTSGCVELLKARPRLFADETTAPVLDPGRGRTKTGYLWAIARDDRPWGGTDPPAVVYVYAPGRGAEHAVALPRRLQRRPAGRRLRRLQELAAPSPARRRSTLAFCWSHLPAPVLRDRRRRQRADRERGARAHRGALRDRGRDPRPTGAKCGTQSAQQRRSRSSTR